MRRKRDTQQVLVQSHWISAYLRWTLAHRKLVIASVIVLSIASAALLATRAVISSDIIELFFADNPKYDRHKVLEKKFASDEVVVLAVDDAQLFTPSKLAGIRQGTKCIKGLEWVRRVQSLSTVQRISGTAEELIVKPYLPPTLDDKGVAAARQGIVSDPLYGGIIVSKDGTKTALVIEPLHLASSAEAWGGMLDDARKCLTDAGFAAGSLHLAGGPVLLDALIQSSRANIGALFPFTVAALLLLVWLLFHNFWPIFVTMATALFSLLWTMAFSVALNPKISILASIVPVVVVVIAFSDNIHLCSAYVQQIARGLRRREALLASGGEVGLACYYTSITTLIGFASLAFVPAPAVRHLAFVLAFGVSVALWTTLTLTPLILSALKPPKPLQYDRGLSFVVDRVARYSLTVSMRRPVMIVILFVLATAVAGWGLSRLTVDADVSERFPKDHQVNKAKRLLEEHLIGANHVDVYVGVDKDMGALDRRILNAVAQTQRDLEARGDVASTLSIVDILKRVHGQLIPGVKELPETRQGIAQLMLLFEMAGGKDTDQLIDFKRRQLRMVLRIHTDGQRHTSAIVREAEAMLRARVPASANARIESAGLTNIFGDWLDRLLEGQRNGLGFAIGSIAIVMIFAVRAFSVGLLSMIPNLIPLLWLGGALGLAYTTVDSDMFMVAVIAIGIAVDDTIHFLTRLRLETQRHGPGETALQKTMDVSGRSIVKTTVILGVGFSPLLFSDYLSVAIVGSWLPATLVFALIADLLLLPAMVKLGWIRFTPSKSE